MDVTSLSHALGTQNKIHYGSLFILTLHHCGTFWHDKSQNLHNNHRYQDTRQIRVENKHFRICSCIKASLHLPVKFVVKVKYKPTWGGAICLDTVEDQDVDQLFIKRQRPLVPNRSLCIIVETFFSLYGGRPGCGF